MSTFEKIWSSFALVVVALIVFYVFFIPKHIHSYYLGSESSTLEITVDIENYVDQTIDLDRNITYVEAVAIVDSLNKTIKR